MNINLIISIWIVLTLLKLIVSIIKYNNEKKIN